MISGSGPVRAKMSFSSGVPRLSLRARAKSPRASASFAVPISGGPDAGPELLVVVGEHLGALVVLTPDVNGVVRAVELAHGAAGALLHVDDGHGGGDAAGADDRRGRLLHGDAVEGAGVDAVDAAGALLQLNE